MKIMAIDYGDAHTGIAVSDALLTLAGFTTVITAYRPEAVAAEIQRLIAEHGITELVLGHPLNMDGTEQPLTARARNFANKIHGRFGVQITLHDERLSTVEARAGLFEHGGFRALNKGSVDSASAVIILESYFEQSF